MIMIEATIYKQNTYTIKNQDEKTVTNLYLHDAGCPDSNSYHMAIWKKKGEEPVPSLVNGSKVKVVGTGCRYESNKYGNYIEIQSPKLLEYVVAADNTTEEVRR